MSSLSSSLVSFPAPVVAEGALESARAALEAYLSLPDDPSAVGQLRDALRSASEWIVGHLPADLSGEESRVTRELLVAVSGSGVHDSPAAEEDLRRAEMFAAQDAAGLLAAMLLVPSWQWPGAPRLAQVPPALIADFTTWLIAVPQGFVAPGQAELFAGRHLLRIEDLLRFARAKATAELGRTALAVYLKHGNCIPLYFSTDSLRRHYEVRAQLLQCAVVRPAVTLTPRPRAGRRLRIGFINRHFGPQTESYTTLPMFEQLDPERFEVLLFAHQTGGSALEEYARHHAAAFTVLRSEPGAQIDQLRAAALDVAVLGTNVTAVFNDVTRIALHRIAPLQVVNNSSCTTTGLPEVDLYVSGTLTEADDAPAHFTERLGLVAGPAHAFNYEADRQEPAGSWTRAMLGLPEDAVVFVTAANYFKIIPEMQEAWARLLAAVPGSRLLLHPFNPNWSSSYPIKRFSAELDRVFAAHGVATDRVVISSNKFPSRSDVKSLLAVGDVYLDTFPFGGVNSLVDPLELGMPVVVWEGSAFRARMGGALLRSLGLADLIATDEASYLSLATQLALDSSARETTKARIADAMGQAPVFLDPLAASDAFGALVEAAYDELLAVGRTEFRRRRDPIVLTRPADAMALIHEGVASFEAGDIATASSLARQVLGSDPAHPAARHLLGAILLRSGNALRATDYFLGAVQHCGDNAPLWHDLAVALCESGRQEQAVQALETSLRLAPERLDGWLLFAELALAANNQDLFGHALDIAVQLAPDDARIAELRARSGGTVPADPSDVPSTPHVLLYTDDPDRGGVAHYNHSVLLALARAGHRVSCVQSTSEGPLVQEQRAAGVQHHWLDYDTGKDFARTIDDEASARRIFEAALPDLIIFSDCCPVSNLAAREAALRLGIPYIVVVGFVGVYLAKNFASQLPVLARHYAAAREVVAVSAENLALLRSHFGLGVDAGRVIHYGRPEKFFAPRDETTRARLRAELNLPADAIVCLTAARLTAVKGFLYQLVAASHLVKRPDCSRLHFVWAGDGDQRAEIERTIAQSGLAGRVHLLGHRWDVADWYDAADIFVLPSDLEGMPLAIMEAMAKGLPVVATAVSGIPEELGHTGALLTPAARDANALIRDLVHTLELWTKDGAQRARLGEAGRQRAQAMFREELMLTRTLDLVSATLPACSFDELVFPTL
jgi:protein O-GlcNAc transferase